VAWLRAQAAPDAGLAGRLRAHGLDAGQLFGAVAPYQYLPASVQEALLGEMQAGIALARDVGAAVDRRRRRMAARAAGEESCAICHADMPAGGRKAWPGCGHSFHPQCL